jgi:hypothetical protein
VFGKSRWQQKIIKGTTYVPSTLPSYDVFGKQTAARFFLLGNTFNLFHNYVKLASGYWEMLRLCLASGYEIYINAFIKYLDTSFVGRVTELGDRFGQLLENYKSAQ